ncbi:hypothetical protein BH23VER1_BH23VER1_30480 [soil metagenome]
MTMKALILIAVSLVGAGVAGAAAGADERPVFRDFLGLNGHTVQFKPGLYKPVCRIVRDYHPVKWDLGGDTEVLPEWPFAKNRVSWEDVYGSWNEAGLRISVCLIFDDMEVGDWNDLEADGRAYARSFAENFGPNGRWPFVEWVEIGNEPGLYSDDDYRKLFRAMAEGIREGDPDLKVVTCNVEAGGSDRYWKGVGVVEDMGSLFDAVQIHRYAIKDQWPVWRRTFPEDPAVPYLSSIQDLLDWRDRSAPEKEVWVSEFGWDASSQDPDPDGEWAEWVDSTDEEQAMWIVRSFFRFAEMGVDKAMVYFFNDSDEPKLHAASGLTRNYQPKPAYHAVAWMLEALADHRLGRVLRGSLEDGYHYEFVPEKEGGPRIWAAWLATGEDGSIEADFEGAKVVKAELMPLEAGDASEVVVDAASGQIPAGVRPRLIWLQ